MKQESKFGIAATAYYIPEKKISVASIVKEMGIEEHFVKNIGIEEIYVTEDETQSGMAFRVAKELLQDQGMKADDLDMIICSSNLPEKLAWSASAKLAHQLGLRPFPTLDIFQACNSFVAAMDIAQKYFIANPEIRHILYVTADKSPIKYLPGFSFYTHGAAAVLFSRNNIIIEPLSIVFFSDGSFADHVYIMGGLEEARLGGDLAEQMGKPNQAEFFMDLFRTVLTYTEKAVTKALDMVPIDREEIDLFIPNNTTNAVPFFLKERLNLKEEKIFVENIPRGRHVGASDIIINLHDIIRQKKTAGLLKACLISYAGGFYCGSAVLNIY